MSRWWESLPTSRTRTSPVCAPTRFQRLFGDQRSHHRERLSLARREQRRSPPVFVHNRAAAVHVILAHAPSKTSAANSHRRHGGDLPLRPRHIRAVFLEV